MTHLYHVTPLFLLPAIIVRKGLSCGADVEKDRLPRRKSSRSYDDKPLDGLGGKRVADCVLLFLQRKPMNNMLINKLCGNRNGGTWRCYPHVVLRFDSYKCFNILEKPVCGVSANVGRTLRAGKEPIFRHYDAVDKMIADKVQEILILANKLPERLLPLECLDSIEVFSNSDKQLVHSVLERSTFSAAQVVLSDAEKRVSCYTAGQSREPGISYLRSHQDLFSAIQQGDQIRRLNLIERLSADCFD